MQFTDYQVSEARPLGSTDHAKIFGMVELSDGNFVVMDVKAGCLRLRKLKRHTTEVMEKREMKIHHNKPLVPNTTNHIDISFNIRVQPNQDQFVVSGIHRHGGVFLNIWGNDMTLKKVMKVGDKHYYYGNLQVAPEGQIVYYASRGSFHNPEIFYYSAEGEFEWKMVADTGGQEWFGEMAILSNGNLVVGAVQRIRGIGGDGQFHHMVVNKEGEIIQGPQVDPVGYDINHVNSVQIVPYTDHYAVFWSASNDLRFASRYTNEGELIPQENYLIQDHDGDKQLRDTDGISIPTPDGEVLVTVYRNSNTRPNEILVALNNPAEIGADGRMSEDQMIIRQPYHAYYPQVTPLAEGGFALVYYTSNRQLHYQTFVRSSAPQIQKIEFEVEGKKVSVEIKISIE